MAFLKKNLNDNNVNKSMKDSLYDEIDRSEEMISFLEELVSEENKEQEDSFVQSFGEFNDLWEDEEIDEEIEGESEDIIERIVEKSDPLLQSSDNLMQSSETIEEIEKSDKEINEKINAINDNLKFITELFYTEDEPDEIEDEVVSDEIISQAYEMSKVYDNEEESYDVNNAYELDKFAQSSDIIDDEDVYSIQGDYSAFKDYSDRSDLEWADIAHINDYSAIKYPAGFDIENANFNGKSISHSDFSLVRTMRWEHIKGASDISGVAFPESFDIENADFTGRNLSGCDFSRVRSLKWEDINLASDVTYIKYPPKFSFENIDTEISDISGSNLSLLSQLRVSSIRLFLDISGIIYPKTLDLSQGDFAEMDISGSDFSAVENLKWKHIENASSIKGITYPFGFDAENAYFAGKDISYSNFSRVESLKFEHIRHASNIAGVIYPPQFDIENADFYKKNIDFSDFSHLPDFNWDSIKFVSSKEGVVYPSGIIVPEYTLDQIQGATLVILDRLYSRIYKGKEKREEFEKAVDMLYLGMDKDKAQELFDQSKQLEAEDSDAIITIAKNGYLGDKMFIVKLAEQRIANEEERVNIINEILRPIFCEDEIGTLDTKLNKYFESATEKKRADLMRIERAGTMTILLYTLHQIYGDEIDITIALDEFASMYPDATPNSVKATACFTDNVLSEENNKTQEKLFNFAKLSEKSIKLGVLEFAYNYYNKEHNSDQFKEIIKNLCDILFGKLSKLVYADFLKTKSLNQMSNKYKEVKIPDGQGRINIYSSDAHQFTQTLIALGEEEPTFYGMMDKLHIELNNADFFGDSGKYLVQPTADGGLERVVVVCCKYGNLYLESRVLEEWGIDAEAVWFAANENMERLSLKPRYVLKSNHISTYSYIQDDFASYIICRKDILKKLSKGKDLLVGIPCREIAYIDTYTAENADVMQRFFKDFDVKFTFEGRKYEHKLSPNLFIYRAGTDEIELV